MDFVKKEDHNLADEEQYKAYIESLKMHQMEAEHQHTQISMEQLHQVMQSSLNASTIVHNFQLPLSPRQMSTLMLKTNHLNRNFNEIPSHLPRNLSDADLVQNLAHDLPHWRHDELLLNQNLGRNLDLTLARNLSSELELQSNVAQSLVQNLSDHDLARSLSNDLNRISNLPEDLRGDLQHSVNHEIDLSQHLNRVEQEILSQEEPRRQMVMVQDGHITDQSMTQRLVNQTLMHDNQRLDPEHLIPMPFHIKAEQEDEYLYDIHQGLNIGNALNGNLPVQSEHNISDQMYVYNNITNIPALNAIDLYSRQQNYVQTFSRDNPQNLVMHRQFENASSYNEELKKSQDGGLNGAREKEEPKENLKPTDQNKLYNEFSHVYADDKTDSNSSDSKLTITEDLSLIKGEYLCYKCNNIFPSKRGVKLHLKSCTLTENESDMCKGKFACTQCSYRCKSPAILKIHERTHSGDKPFSCTFCDYKSGQKNNVAKHILVHMKEKPFRCQYCEYRCAQKNNLVVHERTHTGFKPFACPYCDYRTVQKPNLVKHMYLHTNQKPFSCDMCSYKCVQKTNLTKHKQRHLNQKEGDKVDVKNENKPYRPRQKSVKCQFCPYKCVQKSSLDKHVQFKHSQNSQIEFVSSYVGSDEMGDESKSEQQLMSDENVMKSDEIQNLSVRKDAFSEDVHTQS